MLDLMIAAEALYLSELGSAKDRGELRSRLALRAAYWSNPGNVGRSRVSVFTLMRCAYDVRSAIAHGGRPKASDLKIDGQQTSMEEVLGETRKVLRAALLKAVLSTESSDRWTVDWDTEIVARLDEGPPM